MSEPVWNIQRLTERLSQILHERSNRSDLPTILAAAHGQLTREIVTEYEKLLADMKETIGLLVKGQNRSVDEYHRIKTERDYWEREANSLSAKLATVKQIETWADIDALRNRVTELEKKLNFLGEESTCTSQPLDANGKT